MAIIKKGSFVEKKTVILTSNQSINRSLNKKSMPDSVNAGSSNVSSATNETYRPEEISFSTGAIDTSTQSLAAEKERLEDEIAQLKNKATEEINAMKAKAHRDIEELREQARSEGFASGKEEVEREYADRFQELGNAIAQVIGEKNRIIQETEHELLKLSIKIAEQIIKSEISLNQAIALNIVSEAIAKITDRDKVAIKVSKQDYEFVSHNKDRIGSIVDGIRNLTVQEDVSIEPGGCIIETDLGYVDSRIIIKLEAIQNALEKAVTAQMTSAPVTRKPAKPKEAPPIIEEEETVEEDRQPDEVYTQTDDGIPDFEELEEDNDDFFDFDDDDLFK